MRIHLKPPAIVSGLLAVDVAFRSRRQITPVYVGQSERSEHDWGNLIEGGLDELTVLSGKGDD